MAFQTIKVYQKDPFGNTGFLLIFCPWPKQSFDISFDILKKISYLTWHSLKEKMYRVDRKISIQILVASLLYKWPINFEIFFVVDFVYFFSYFC